MNAPPGRDVPRRGRVLLASVLALVAATLAVAALAFVWPGGTQTSDVGSPDEFAPGTVTTYNLIDGSLVRSRDGRTHSSHSVHVVRLGDGELLALSARDPHLGYPTAWVPDLVIDGERGWFRNPLHDETYDLAGTLVSGPSRRGLDRFGVAVERGRVVVDLGSLTPGSQRSARRTTMARPVTPTPAATESVPAATD